MKTQTPAPEHLQPPGESPHHDDFSPEIPPETGEIRGKIQKTFDITEGAKNPFPDRFAM